MNIKKTAFIDYLEDFKEETGRNYIIIDNSILKNFAITRISGIMHLIPDQSKIIIAEGSFLLSHYVNYFDDSSKLFPFIFITYPDYIEGNKSTRILLDKFIEDESIRLIPRGLFSIAQQKVIVLRINKNKDSF